MSYPPAASFHPQVQNSSEPEPPAADTFGMLLLLFQISCRARCFHLIQKLVPRLSCFWFAGHGDGFHLCFSLTLTVRKGQVILHFLAVEQQKLFYKNTLIHIAHRFALPCFFGVCPVMNRHLCLRSLAFLDEHAVADLEAFGQVLRQILVEGKAESLFRKRQKQGMRLFSSSSESCGFVERCFSIAKRQISSSSQPCFQARSK